MNIKTSKNKILLILSIPLVLLAICIGTSSGSSNISIFDTFSILANKFFSVQLLDGIDPKQVTIIWNLRLPRVLLAFMVGGSLAASGAIVQSVLKNQLASPYTLGLSSGASLGVGIIIVTGVSIPFLGYIGANIINQLALLYNIKQVIYFVTPNWDLSCYLFGGSPLFKELTPAFSIIVCVIYLIIMLVLNCIVFKKRDIKNI